MERGGARGTPDENLLPLDDQQVLLLTILRGRGGDPVTYAELQSSGIEFPASLVSELELANIEVERCRVAGSGTRLVPAVRLPSAAKEASVNLAGEGGNRQPAQVTPSPGWGPVHVYRGSRLRALGATLGRGSGAQLGVPSERQPSRRPRDRSYMSRRPGTRILVLLALLVGIAVVVAVIVTGTAGASPHAHLTSQHRPTRGAHAASAQSSSDHPTATVGQTATGAPGAPRLPTTPVSPARAAALQARATASLTPAGRGPPCPCSSGGGLHR